MKFFEDVPKNFSMSSIEKTFGVATSSKAASVFVIAGVSSLHAAFSTLAA